MFTKCFLRGFLFLSALFCASHQVSVFHETPNIPQTDQCQMCCGTKGQLPLIEIDGGYYYFYHDEANKKSWFEAHDFCRQHNMELVTIDSAAENEAIKQKLSGLKNGDFCWIGLNDFAKQGEFRWVTTGSAAIFKDFHQGEPNNPGKERCGDIWLNITLKWNNSRCDRLQVAFICEVTDKNLLYLHAN